MKEKKNVDYWFGYHDGEKEILEKILKLDISGNIKKNMEIRREDLDNLKKKEVE